MGKKKRWRSINEKKFISRLMVEGKKHESGCIEIFICSNDKSYFRVVMRFSSKSANAVVRNRFKRWTRHFLMEKFSRISVNLGFLDILITIKQRRKDFYNTVKNKEFHHYLEKSFDQIPEFNVQEG